MRDFAHLLQLLFLLLKPLLNMRFPTASRASHALRGQMLEGPLFDCDDNVTQAAECEEGLLHWRDCL